MCSFPNIFQSARTHKDIQRTILRGLKAKFSKDDLELVYKYFWLSSGYGCLRVIGHTRCNTGGFSLFIGIRLLRDAGLLIIDGGVLTFAIQEMSNYG